MRRPHRSGLRLKRRSFPILVFLISTQIPKRLLPKRSVERAEGTKRGKTFDSVSFKETMTFQGFAYCGYIFTEGSENSGH